MVPVARQTGTTGTATAARTATDHKALVDRYCVSCHNDRLRTGDVSLEVVDFTNLAVNADVLERAVRKMGAGAMPPQGLPRPDPETHAALVTWLATGLDAAAADHPDPGRAILRRLNRTEYANAIRDLLDLDVDVSALLPVDNSSYGFDNIADVLGVSPVLMERYLTAARRISAVAVGDAAEIPVTDAVYRTRPDLSQDRYIDGLPFGTRGGLLATHTFPVDAEYVFRLYPLQTTVSNIRGLQDPHDIILLIDGDEVARATIGGHDDYEYSLAHPTPSLDQIHERLTFRLPVKAGPREVGVTFVMRTPALDNATLQPFRRTAWDLVSYLGVPHVERVVVNGPFDVTGPGHTPSRARVFQCQPSSPADEPSCARTILSSLAHRAYRRPLADGDLATLMEFFEAGRERGGFETGIALGLRRILASPDFVFRIEREPAALAAGSVYPVSDVALASRLSFFLWSSMPDDELLRVAEEGQLRDEGELDRQMTRMLADPRAQSLVDNFAGQWLYLRNLRSHQPDLSEFPDFDDVLRGAMLEELELFFGSVVREDRSLVDLMTARDTFVNESLARHYGIPNIYGSHFRRVTLEDDARRGLLGKAAILAVTSYPTRTSPVIRGKWILENIVGTPPPPPPPNVDTNLGENARGQQARSLRARLEDHRRNPTCAACHRLMDPIGFAMEPFDAVGAARQRDNDGLPIDAAGQLANGVKVDGPSSLRDALVADPTIFVTTATEKLMTYALGRGLGAHDMPAVRQVVRTAGRNGYRFSSIVSGVVNSVPFQMRVKAPDQGPSPETVVARTP